MLKPVHCLSILIMAIVMSIGFLDSSIIPMAIPYMQKLFKLSPYASRWVMNSYFLSCAIFVIIGGALVDRLGSKKTLIIGSLFITVSVFCMGFISHLIWLFILRAFQGIGTAIIGPASMTMLLQNFSHNNRGKAMGMAIALSSLSLIIGPVISGVLINHFSCLMAFYIKIPLCLVAVICCLKIPTYKPKNIKPLDLRGFCYLASALVFLIFGVMNIKYWGWVESKTLTLLCFSIICFYILYQHCCNCSHPILDMHILRKKFFLGGIGVLFCSQFLLANMIFWAIFFQKTLHFSVVKTGMFCAISTLPIILLAPASGWLSDHFGPKVPMVLGFTLSFCACLSTIVYAFAPNDYFLMLNLLIFYSGLAFVMSPIGSSTLGRVDLEKRGIATGIYNCVRHLSSAMAVAILGSVKALIKHLHFNSAIAQVPEFQNYTSKQLIKFISKCPDEGVPYAFMTKLHQVYDDSTFKALVGLNMINIFICLSGIIVSMSFVYSKYGLFRKEIN